MQDAYIVTLQRILKALIRKSTVIKKLCKNLQLDDHGTIVINVYPIFANGVNLQENNVCTIIVGHYESVRQGNGVMTKNREGTCLTFDQVLAAAWKVDSSFTLSKLGFIDNLLPLKFNFCCHFFRASNKQQVSFPR